MCDTDIVKDECFGYRGFKVIIRYDRFAENPIELRGFTLVSYRELANASDYGGELDVAVAGELGSFAETKKAAIRYLEGEVIYLPVYVYEHSAVAYSTSPFNCPWDSGRYGIIAITREHVRKIYGVKRITSELEKRIESEMEYAIREYTAYANGWIYEYEIEDKDSEPIDEYCGGFIDMDYCKETAKNTIDDIFKHKNRVWQKRLKDLAREHVPLFDRVKIRKAILQEGVC